MTSRAIVGDSLRESRRPPGRTTAPGEGSVLVTRGASDLLSAPTHFACLLLCLLAACGCAERPKAPPLVNDTVYQNDKLGLRFLAPDGWSLVTRTDLPSSPLPKPIILVAYHLSKGESFSELEVLAADLAEGADLGQFLIEHRIGPAVWTLKPPPEAVTVNGVDATRLVLTRQKGKTEMRREATAFRRGGRVYFFIVTFAAGDAAARDAARQSVQSVDWTK
jgi:hypothetical protein